MFSLPLHRPAYGAKFQAALPSLDESDSGSYPVYNIPVAMHLYIYLLLYTLLAAILSINISITYLTGICAGAIPPSISRML